MEKESKHHVGSSFDDSDWLGGAALDIAADFLDADFGGTDAEDVGIATLQSDNLALQNLDGCPQGLDFELNEVEGSIIRVAERQVKRRGRSQKAAGPQKTYITHEDFEEGPERDAFLLIYGYAEMLFEDADKGATAACIDKVELKRRKAIEFFFCNRPDALNFEEAAACIDAEIRIDVLRMRFMYEMWLRKWALGPLPTDAVSMPTRVELMAARFGGILAIQMAHEAWFNPGIEGKALLDLVTNGETGAIQQNAQTALSQLVDAYVLSVADKNIYCTGVNPLLELEDRQNDPTLAQRSRLANIYWSRRW